MDGKRRGEVIRRYGRIAVALAFLAKPLGREETD
jgi:hypothetical protein